MHHRYVTYIKHIVSIYCITYIFTQWKTVYIYTHILSVYHIYEPYIYILYSINASYVIHEISNHIYIDISYIIYISICHQKIYATYVSHILYICICIVNHALYVIVLCISYTCIYIYTYIIIHSFMFSHVFFPYIELQQIFQIRLRLQADFLSKKNMWP